ncbi:helix-turn-helix domain-containing protein [Streptomyces sp. NPDC004096]
MTEREFARRVRHRLAALRQAEEVSGNMAATCRYYSISRQCSYTRRRRYEAEGLDGLKNCSSAPLYALSETAVRMTVMTDGTT